MERRMKPVQIYRMKDSTEGLHKKKGLMFDMPFRIALVGKSMLSGKTSLAISLLYQEDSRLYKHDFAPENIFIFSPSAKTDFKLKTFIQEKEVPDQNVFTTYDEDEIDTLYELLKDEYNEKIANKEKPEHKLFYFDDMTFGGQLKKKMNGVISKIMCNGRHFLLNTLITSQVYVDLPRCVREQLTGLIIFSGTDRQLDIVMEEHNYLEDKKQFRKMYREVTKDPHAFLVVNYSNPMDSRYMNREFLPIGPCGKVKGRDCKCD